MCLQENYFFPRILVTGKSLQSFFSNSLNCHCYLPKDVPVRALPSTISSTCFSVCFTEFFRCQSSCSLNLSNLAYLNRPLRPAPVCTNPQVTNPFFLLKHQNTLPQGSFNFLSFIQIFFNYYFHQQFTPSESEFLFVDLAEERISVGCD